MAGLTVVVDAVDPSRLAEFWTAMVGADGPVDLRFVPGAAADNGDNPLHLHVTTEASGDLAGQVATALRHGATHLDVGQLPEESHVVLADPEGNAFCLIEPTNRFLAGCGPLGEIACDGTRDVGLFWSRALGWPLVWDQDEETAIQSPAGGTKVAWGGPPLAPRIGRARQRFELRDVDVDGLVALGAERLAERDDVLVLADPDGNEFWLRRT